MPKCDEFDFGVKTRSKTFKRNPLDPDCEKINEINEVDEF